jgi:UDP-N-acetylglucosamine 2-epimerase (non-hydrolysing)
MTSYPDAHHVDLDRIAMLEDQPVPGRIMVVIGTRPEAVKLAPLVLRARSRPGLRPIVVTTGQHRELARQMLDFLGVAVDIDLTCGGGDLATLTAALQASLAEVMVRERVETVIVQGDTASALAGALAGFYLRRRVHHVEAGLRSGDLASPFPEEANRRLISVVAGTHYAPTDAARGALLGEGVDPGSVLVTGNTGVDALLHATELVRGTAPTDPVLRDIVGAAGDLMLVTAHRRESWGAGLDGVAEGIRRVVERHPRLRVLLPVHRNPVVRSALVSALSGIPQVALTDPLDYPDMVRALGAATLVLTDSGGVQEEAATLGVPTLVTRATTERPEGIAAAGLRLVGTDPATIARHVDRLLGSASARAAMSCTTMPFGDGRAAERIVDHLAAVFTADRSTAVLTTPAPSAPDRSTAVLRPRPASSPPAVVGTSPRFEGVSR